MDINGVWVQDSFELLDGELLTPYHVDEMGTVYTQTRFTREVFISAGDVSRRYGGPEEGGWWYDWFTSVLDLSLDVSSVEDLTTALTHVEALLRMTLPHEESRDLRIVIQPDSFYRQEPMRYE